MMRINVLAELREPPGTETKIEISEGLFVADTREIERLNGTARLTRTNRGLLVGLSASGFFRESCARCLTDVESEVKVRFEEEYIPRLDPGTGWRIHGDAEIDAFRISDEFYLDLGEGIRQYLLMSESAKPLCRPDCAGLCAECGTDRNVGQCRCRAETDERGPSFAVLTHEKPGGN